MPGHATAVNSEALAQTERGLARVAVNLAVIRHADAAIIDLIKEIIDGEQDIGLLGRLELRHEANEPDAVLLDEPRRVRDEPVETLGRGTEGCRRRSISCSVSSSSSPSPLRAAAFP